MNGLSKTSIPIKTAKQKRVRFNDKPTVTMIPTPGKHSQRRLYYNKTDYAKFYLDTHPMNKSAVANGIIKAKTPNTDLIDFIHRSLGAPV